MHAGSSLAWLFPNRSLHTCGTSSPTQPTCPHIATHEAVIAAQQTMHTARRRGMFVPNVRASSPGSGSRLSFQRSSSKTPQETAIAGAPSFKAPKPAALRLPISQ